MRPYSSVALDLGNRYFSLITAQKLWIYIGKCLIMLPQSSINNPNPWIIDNFTKLKPWFFVYFQRGEKTHLNQWMKLNINTIIILSKSKYWLWELNIQSISQYYIKYFISKIFSKSLLFFWETCCSNSGTFQWWWILLNLIWRKGKI